MSMRLPICGACLESKELCENCSGRVAKGEIQHSDVELARAMNQLAKENPQIEKAEFLKTHSHDDLLVVVVPKGTAGQIIGKKGVLIKELCMHMKKRIKVVEDTSEKRDFVEKVLNPAQLRGLNVTGSKYHVRVSKMDMGRIGNKVPFEKIFEKVLGGKAEIVFE